MIKKKRDTDIVQYRYDVFTGIYRNKINKLPKRRKIK